MVGSGICSCIEIRVDRVIVLAQCVEGIRFPSHCCFNAPAQISNLDMRPLKLSREKRLIKRGVYS